MDQLRKPQVQTKVGDVYLLLKSSDFVAFDLGKAWIVLMDDRDSTGEWHGAVDEMSNLAINKPSQGSPTMS